MIPDRELLKRAAQLSSATVHEALGKRGALPASIKPLAPSVRLCGPALPVTAPPGDNLWLHRAIYAARPGEVLVVDTGAGVDHGYWGEVMAVAAQVRHIAGLVISGGVRDSLRLVEMGFPVCAATTCIVGTTKNPAGKGQVGNPVILGDAEIHRGDLVIGDADGVVVIPSASLTETVLASEQRDTEEASIFERLRAGETTIDIYKLPRESRL